MNLSAVNVDKLIEEDVAGLYNGDYIIAAVMNTNCELGRSSGAAAAESGAAKGYLGRPILHDTCFLLDINKTSGDDQDEAEDMYADQNSALPRMDSKSGTFHVNGEIIGPLKVVLSKDIYEQILQTLDNLVYGDYEERILKEEAGGGTAAAAASGKENATGASASTERKKSFASDETTDSAVGAYDLSLGQDANDVIKIHFKLPMLQVEIKGNFGAEEVSSSLHCG